MSVSIRDVAKNLGKGAKLSMHKRKHIQIFMVEKVARKTDFKYDGKLNESQIMLSNQYYNSERDIFPLHSFIQPNLPSEQEKILSFCGSLPMPDIFKKKLEKPSIKPIIFDEINLLNYFKEKGIVK